MCHSEENPQNLISLFLVFYALSKEERLVRLQSWGSLPLDSVEDGGRP